MKKRRIKAGDQYEFDCGSADEGGYGKLGYALVLRKEPGSVPLIATFTRRITEGDISNPEFAREYCFLGGAEPEPMTTGKWKWIGRLPIGEEFPIPRSLIATFDVEANAVTYSINQMCSDEFPKRCTAEHAKKYKQASLYANEAQVKFDTLAGIHGLPQDPTIDQYEAVGDDFREFERLRREHFLWLQKTLKEIDEKERASQSGPSASVPYAAPDDIQLEDFGDEPESDTDEHVIELFFKLENDHMGTPEERERFWSLEDRITDALLKSDLGSCEGSGFGLGYFTMSLICNDKDAALALLEEVTAPNEFPAGSYVAVSRAATDDEVPARVAFTPRRA